MRNKAAFALRALIVLAGLGVGCLVGLVLVAGLTLLHASPLAILATLALSPLVGLSLGHKAAGKA